MNGAAEEGAPGTGAIRGALLVAALAAFPAPPAALPVETDGIFTAYGATSTRAFDDVFPVAGLHADPRARVTLGTVQVYSRWSGRLETPWPESQEFLREAHVDFSLGPVDLRMGKQIIKWGKADGINPTDNLAVFDFTLPVHGRDAARTGTYALLGEAAWGDLGLELAASPYFLPTRIPVPRGLEEAHNQPGWIGRSPGTAARVTYRGSLADGSLSHFHNHVPLPYISLLQPGLHYYRAHVLGADAEAAAGKWILRGEAAWARPYGAPPRPRSSVRYVLAAERSFSGSFWLNAQFYQSFMPDLPPIRDDLPAAVAEAMRRERALNQQTTRILQGWTCKVLFTPPGSRWKAEMTGVINLPGKDSFLSPRAEYGFSDHLRAGLGFEWFRGDAGSIFGQYAKNDRAQLELVLLY